MSDTDLLVEQPDPSATPAWMNVPAPKAARTIRVRSLVIAGAAAALVIGGALGGVVWQQHSAQPVPATVADPPKTPADLLPEGGSLVVPTPGQQPQTLGEWLRQERIAEVASEWPDRSKLVQQHPAEQLPARDSQWALFDARCRAAGGEVLLSLPPMCSVDMPKLDGLPRMTTPR